MPDSMFPGVLLINLADRRTPSKCDDCGARHIGLCDALSDDDLKFLANIAQRVRVPAGRMFVEEGSDAGYFFNINQGTARLSKSLPDGRRQITGFMDTGHFIGLAVSGQAPGPRVYAFSAEAMDEVHLCRFSRTALTAKFVEFPALERKLLDVASHELVVAQEQMLLLGRKTAIERVASFLLSWAVRMAMCPAGVIPAGAVTMKLLMTRMDIADYLGLTIETVSRSLSQLKRDGLIDLDQPHAVTLLEPRKLAELANNTAG